MIRLEQVLITSLKMKRIDVTNTLRSTCNKKQATNSNTMKIDDNDVNKIRKGAHRKDKFEKKQLILV